MKPPFFIVGCGRSGTTLVRSLLTRHPHIQVPGETHYLPLAIRLSPLIDAVPPLSTPTALAKLLCANRRLGLSGITESTLRKWLVEREVGTTAEAVVEVYRLYADLQRDGGGHPSSMQVGDKTPSYVRYMARIAQFLPGSRFVHVIRDGRAVARSMQGMPWGPRSYDGCLNHWERTVRHGRREGVRLGARYLELRYEDLVADPERAMRSVCSFLRVEFDDSMLVRDADSAAHSQQNFFPSTHARLGAPIAAPCYDLSEVAVSRSQSRLLGELNYPPAPPGEVSLASRARAVLDDRMRTGPVSFERIRTIIRLLGSGIGRSQS